MFETLAKALEKLGFPSKGLHAFDYEAALKLGHSTQNRGDHLAEVSEARLIGKEAGDELLRLQVKYARAYTVLQRHAHNCSLCQLVSRIEGRDSENSLDASSDTTLYL